MLTDAPEEVVKCTIRTRESFGAAVEIGDGDGGKKVSGKKERKQTVLR